MALVLVRPAEERDLARILELEAASPEAAQWSLAQCRAALHGEGRLRLLVAEWQGRVAGMIAVRGAVAGEAEILNLAVAPEKRRNGIGRALVREACDGSADLYLEVRRSNQAGLAFYRAHGFEEAARRKDYYDNPREDALVMKLPRRAGKNAP